MVSGCVRVCMMMSAVLVSNSCTLKLTARWFCVLKAYHVYMPCRECNSTNLIKKTFSLIIIISSHLGTCLNMLLFSGFPALIQWINEPDSISDKLACCAINAQRDISPISKLSLSVCVCVTLCALCGNVPCIWYWYAISLVLNIRYRIRFTPTNNNTNTKTESKILCTRFRQNSTNST